MALPPAAHDLGLLRQFLAGRAGRRVHGLGDELVAAQHEAAPFAGDVAQRGLPGVAGVGGGRQIDLHALAVQRHPRQRHVVLPADQPADLAELGVDDGQRAAVALAPDQPLGAGGLELAMLAQQRAVRPEVEQRAVERAAAELAVALDDADGQIGIGLTGRGADGLRGRAGHLHGVGPIALPQPAPLGAAAADHHAEAKAARVGRE